MNSQTQTLLILPTYNEIENIVPFVREVLSNIQTHILIVDDNSPDGTGTLADQLSKENPFISVLHRSKKLGLGSAYVTGFRWALERPFEVIAQMDSDFSHSPKDLPRLIEALAHCDIALGSRYIEGGSIENWPKSRLLVSEIGNIYARSLLGSNVRDLTGGFKAFKRKVIESLALDQILSDGYAFQIETTYRSLKNGFRLTEVPIVFKDRTRGKSKISRKVLWEAMWIPWKLKGLRKV